MSQLTIDTVSTTDTLASGMEKCNTNFTELFSRAPTWLYATGGSDSPANGTFTADSDTASSVNVFHFSPVDSQGRTASPVASHVGGLIGLFNKDSAEYYIVANNTAPPNTYVSPQGGTNGTLSGEYALIGYAPFGLNVQADTGWVVAGSGDKTVSLDDYTGQDFSALTSDGTTFELDGIAAITNMAHQVELLTKKVKALETVGAAGKMVSA